MSPTPSACELQVLDQRVARDSDTSPDPDAPELSRADEFVGHAAANPQYLSGFQHGQCQGKVIEVGDGAVVCAVVVVMRQSGDKLLGVLELRSTAVGSVA